MPTHDSGSGLIINASWHSLQAGISSLAVRFSAGTQTMGSRKDHKFGEVATEIPVIGFNVETIEYKLFDIWAWDVGGCQRVRPLWRHYYQDTQGLVFVVDSNDRDRVDAARDELQHILRDEKLCGVPLLVFAKQDITKALSPLEIELGLGLQDIRDRPWLVQSNAAVAGEGLNEGLDWLMATLTTEREQ